MNKILPELKLSTRNKVIRYIQRVDSFTIKSVAKSCKLKRDTARYHIDKMRDEGYLEDLSDNISHSKDRTYRYVDTLAFIENVIPHSGQSRDLHKRLSETAENLRKGMLYPQEELTRLHTNIFAIIDKMDADLHYLKVMANAEDLWEIKTLVNRIGFNDD